MGRDGGGDRFRIFLSGGGEGAVLLQRYFLKRLIPVLLLPALGPSFALPDLMGALPYQFLPGPLSFPLVVFVPTCRVTALATSGLPRRRPGLRVLLRVPQLVERRPHFSDLTIRSGNRFGSITSSPGFCQDQDPLAPILRRRAPVDRTSGIDRIPDVFMLIVRSAFGLDQAAARAHRWAVRGAAERG